MSICGRTPGPRPLVYAFDRPGRATLAVQREFCHRAAQRPHAIVEKFETSSSGALVTAAEGSSKPVTTRVTHAGIAIVSEFDLRLP
jgi:hypothetical protein